MELLLLLPLLAAGAFLFDWGGDDDDDAVAASGEDIDLEELLGRGDGPPVEDEEPGGEPGEDEPEDDPEDELTDEELRELYAGDDTIEGSDEGDRLYGYAGDDLITGNLGYDTVVGDEGDDTLTGGPGNDVLLGGEGEDSLRGDGGNDRVEGGSGDDTVRGNPGDDSVDGGEGDDLVDGGGGDDFVEGGPGIDTLLGGAGDDLLRDANNPRDTGPGWSVMDGGDGDDALSFEGGSTVTGGEGEDRFVLHDDLFDEQVAQITDFDPAADELVVLLDVNETSGGELSLEPWEDGTGADLYYGDDLIVEIAGGQDLDLSMIDVRLHLDEETGAESFTAGDGNDRIAGNSVPNMIDAGGGNDVVRADRGAGADLVIGGEGNDSLSGTGGMVEDFDAGNGQTIIVRTVETDTLIGGEGDDLLISENGADLTGGPGADTFGIDYLGTLEGAEPLPATQVRDYDPAEDLIVVSLPRTEDPEDLSVAVWEDGQGADIMLDGMVLANVMGGQSLTLADIRVVDRGELTFAL
ncbi:MAG: calcium-binding protein [Roseovarius sp.]|uniref:calcium-binding protein n=1 Tax=Roseovarius sp. TaxID=1486281 RepID=UPI0032EB232A